MRKFVALSVVAGLCIVGAAGPAQAKKKPKPVLTTLYMHGGQPVGELDGVQWLADPGDVNTMDAEEPTGGQPKSMYWGLPVWNDQCTGLPVGFPTWLGELNGKIVGDAKLTVYSLSAPGSITARIWTDTAVFSCNTDYVQPASEVQGTVPSGQGSFEIVFPKLSLTASLNVIIELLGPTLPGRVLYDATSAATKLEFMCIPAKGEKTCA